MADRIEARWHTFGRLFPPVIGKFAGIRLRKPATPMQAVSFTASLLGLFVTRGLWMHLGDPALHIAVLIGLPLLIARRVRMVLIEGRRPDQAFIAALAFLAVPRKGHSGSGEPEARPFVPVPVRIGFTHRREAS